MGSRLEELERALRNADAAGDTQAARKLAQAYREEQLAADQSLITPEMARQELARRELARRHAERDTGPNGDGSGLPQPQLAGGAPAVMTIEQERALALARARRRRAEVGTSEIAPTVDDNRWWEAAPIVQPAPGDEDRWWEAYPVVQDASGQRFDNNGVPVGGRSPAVQSVEIPGLGLAEFPAGMSDEEMSRAIERATVDQPEMFSSASANDRWWEAYPIVQPAPSAAGTFGGAGMNATAGANETLYGVAGAPVDLVRGAMNLVSRGVNAVTGATLPQIPQDSLGGSQWIGETLGAIRPELDPQNTVAATGGERLARGAGQGAAGAILPAAVIGGAARAGMLSQQAAQTGAQMFGRSSSTGAVAGDALAGSFAGAGATLGGEMAGERYAPLGSLVGGLLGGGIGGLIAGVPGLAREGAAAARRYIEPLTASGQQQMAARTLQEAAQGGAVGDPRAFGGPAFSTQEFIESLPGSARTLVPGSEPTTFQATGNMGIGALERSAQTRDPVPFQQRRADQNAARVASIESIQPTGSPETVAAAVRQRLNAIEAAGEEATRSATGAARKAAEAIGPGMRPEDAGASVRTSLEASRAQAKEAERALWSAVDPDGTLALAAGNARRQAADITRGMPASAKPPSGEEAAILNTLARYPEGAVPFAEITALASRVKAEMRAERLANGESPAYRRLSQVNTAIQSDLDSAIVGRVAQEAEAVAAGRMPAADTIEARWLAKTEEWLAGRAEARATGSAGGTGSFSFAGGGSAAFPGEVGAGRQTGRRSGSAAGDPRIPSAAEANFDRAARDRLNAANAATRQRAETFDNRTLGPLRGRPSTTAAYDVPSADVAGRIFFPQARSAEVIGQYRAAVGDDQALAALEGYAVDRLRRVALREDGTFDPQRLTQWRRMHSDALQSFPQLDARLADAGRVSQTMGDVAAAQKQRADAAQVGILGNLLRVESPEDVTRTIGSLFGRQDTMQRLAQVQQAIGSNEEARIGLRKAAADFISGRFVGNTEAATSGVGTIKADQFQTFVRQNKAALAQVFSEAEVDLMERIAADLQRANRSLNAVRIPGQSNTAQDAHSMLQRIVQASADNRGMIGGTAAGAMMGGGIGAVVGGVGAGVLASMRQAGINTVDQLVRDALLDPAKARLLLQSLSGRSAAEAERTLAQRYRSTAVPLMSEGVSEGIQQVQDPRSSAPRADPFMSPRASMVIGASGPRQATQPRKQSTDQQILSALLSGQPRMSASDRKLQEIAAMLIQPGFDHRSAV